MEWPSSFVPDAEKTLIVFGQEFTVPVKSLKLKKWVGRPITNTFGGKPIVEFENRAMFAELAIRKMVENDGWSALWAATPRKSPHFLTDWRDAPLSNQEHLLLEGKLQRKLAEIVTKNQDSYEGCWDVIAWKTNQLLFLESKRRKKDRIQDSQVHWLKAALTAGLSTQNFLIVEWDFGQRAFAA